MQQERAERPSQRATKHYETRIRNLEDVTFGSTVKPPQHQRTRSLTNSFANSEAYLTVARGQPFTDFISHVQSNSPDPPLSPPSGSDSVIINERALTLTTRPFSKLHTVNSSFRSSSTVADCKPWHHSDHLGKPSSAQPPALPDSKGNLVPSEVATSPCCQNRPIVIRGESQHSVRLSSLASLPTRSRLLPPPSALSTVIPSADQSPGLAIASTFVPRPEAHVVSTTTPTAIATQTQDHLVTLSSTDLAA
ncbi:hypothetical protein MJO28_015302 [Puccinia striiformis f. sp. tritici]|uniref:Uncharacterized protein n=1 Tax=Puccinia striiformis f. sp. tritici TaxID=168172 RepID=A0ACC0DSD6_9BASI|nr:hypothetical protein MJO28_015302 [Puccinia striiformis f. sp. tritici]